MKLSQEASVICKLLLATHPEEHEHLADDQQPAIRGSKYSNDFSERFKEFDEEQRAQLSQNPYFAQFAHTHDRRKQIQLYQRSTKQKLDNAQYFKEEGNKAFGLKQFQKANYMYQKALLHFDYTFAQSEEQEKRMQELKLRCHQNYAISLFNLKEFSQAKFHLNQILKAQQSKKALYWMAKIHLKLDDFDLTQHFLNRAQKAGASLQVQSLRAQLNAKTAIYQHKIRTVEKEMGLAV